VLFSDQLAMSSLWNLGSRMLPLLLAIPLQVRKRQMLVLDAHGIRYDMRLQRRSWRVYFAIRGHRHAQAGSIGKAIARRAISTAGYEIYVHRGCKPGN
jgi:hypothetical protein